MPAAGTEDCADLYGSALRDDGGPVIFNLDATPSQNCFDLTFSVFDREGDAENGTVFYVDEFGDTTVSASVTSSAFASFCLEQSGVSVGLVLVDNAGKRSNTLCVHPASPTP